MVSAAAGPPSGGAPPSTCGARSAVSIASSLSRQFAAHGLQFFKVNRTYTHVSVARPQFLDLEVTPVSEGVKRIIAYINAHPRCTRRQLIEALAPAPGIIEIKPATPPANTPAEGETSGASATAPAKPAEPPAVEPTAEQTAVIADLHWLVHQGHVLEFADGRMDTAKKPLPRPPKPEKKPAGEKPAGEGDAAAIAVVPAGEIPVLTEAEIPPSERKPAVEPEPEPAADGEAEAPAPVESASEPPPAEAPPASEPRAAVEIAPAGPAATPAVEPAAGSVAGESATATEAAPTAAPAVEPAEDNPSPS